MRKIFTPILILLSAFAIAQAKQSQRPNILFCLADDWGWPHASIYGDRVVKTPNFDRVAKEGVLFSHAFVSSPSCTPSRNAFITGKYFWGLGSGANLWSRLPEKHQSFIHLLKNDGYTIGRTEAKTWGPGKLDNWIAHYGAHPSGNAYKTFDQFLDNTDATRKPFFFWLGTTDPHRSYVPGTGAESGMDISKVHLFEHYPNSDVVRSDVADYYFEVQRWDRLVGAAIAQLEKHGLLENTIIIITGDHGMPFPRGKGNLYDSGVRVPFAIRWGREVKSGRIVEDYISFADIAPTLLEAACVKIPNDMNGKSFADILKSDKSGFVDPENRSDIVFGRERHAIAQDKPSRSGYPSRGYRNSDFLYIRNYQPELWPAGTDKRDPNRRLTPFSDCDDGPTKYFIINNKDKNDELRRAYQLCFAKRPAEELYDLKKDPGQVNNIANDKAYSKVLKTMKKKLQKKLEALNDPRAKNPDYNEFYQYPYFGG